MTTHHLLKGILITSLLVLAKPISGQEIYLSTTNNSIYRLDTGFVLTLVTTALYPKALTDIAFSSEGKLYGVAKEDIVEINLQTGETNLLKQLPGHDYSYAMGCSDEDKLYLRGQWSDVLYAYDLHAHEFQLINYLGNDQTYDLTFYRGNLMYQSEYHNIINVYDLIEQKFSKIACKPNYPRIEGLSSSMDSCGTEHVYLVDDLSILYEINFQNHLVTPLHFYPTLEYRFSGMASRSEHIGSTCYSHLQSVICMNYELVGLKEVDASSTSKIFPNPADSKINIQLTEPFFTLIEIVDIFGRTLLQINNEESTEIEADISQLPAGMFFIHGITVDGTLSYLGKFMKN